MRALRGFVAVVDRFNYGLGRIMMWGIFALMGVLLWSTWTKFAGSPSLWTLEMAQFVMVGYYILGGPYAMQMGSNVRMDLFYGEFSPRRKAAFDAVTVLFLLTYLGFLMWGGVESTIYAFQYGGERSSSVWRPYIWPIKIVMCIGIALMILQTLSELAKDILFLKTGTPARHDDSHNAEPGDAL
ncbi:MAG: TRAP transporter small permease subunit [Vannielia sp.]|uniref:TRAP transporter small permease subunit n=1 Tax=Vannielia sp. TaxID=2813045 RepID=UPI003B8D45E7